MNHYYKHDIIINRNIYWSVYHEKVKIHNLCSSLIVCKKNCITFTVLAESDAITLPDSVIWDETTADTAMLDESLALRTTESLKSDEEETSHIKNGQVSNIEERSEKAEENVSEAIRDIEPNADILSNGTDLSNGKAEDNKRAQSEMQCENITQGNKNFSQKQNLLTVLRMIKKTNQNSMLQKIIKAVKKCNREQKA